MKYVILILMIIWTWMLMSCQETEYIEVEKLVRDTVKLQTFVDRYFAGVDTVTITEVVEVEVQVPTRQKDSIIYVTEIELDTIFITRVDTIWREKIVYEMDTVYLTRYLPGDTLWLQSTRLVHYIPSEVLHIVQQFYADAEARGKAIKTHYVDIRFKHLDAVEQARSYQTDDQWRLYINDNLTFSEMMVPIYRELSRIQFDKEYSQNPESLLYPFYNAHTIRWDNRNQYIDKLNVFFQ